MEDRDGSAAIVRVLVADDHPVFMGGIARQIEQTDGLTVVAAVGDGQAALDAIRMFVPDVALLDMDMPKLTGLEVLRELKRENITTRVLILTGSAEEEWLLAALRDGARGYIIKNRSWADVASAVHSVARGGTYIDTRLMGSVARGLRREDTELDVLNEREVIVLALARERTAVNVGRELHISEAMVRKHLTSIYSKLGVSGKAAAIGEAMRRGILS